MSDIVTRLWGNTGDKYPGFQNLNTEAAAEITRLRDELEKRIVAHAKLSAANAALEKELEIAKAERNKAAWRGFDRGRTYQMTDEAEVEQKIIDELTSRFGPRPEGGTR